MPWRPSVLSWMDVVLEQSESGRRLITVIAALFGLGALCIAAYHHAPWYIWAIWGPCTGLVVWIVVANEVRTLQVCTDRIRMFDGRNWKDIPLADVSRIEIVTWSEGADTGRIKLRSGQETRLISGTVPVAQALARAVQPHRIKVLRDGEVVDP